MRNFLRIVAVLCVAAAIIVCGSNLAQACNGKGGAGKYGSYGKGMGYGTKLDGLRARPDDKRNT